MCTRPTCLIRRQQWHNKSWRLPSRPPGRVRQTDRSSNAFIIILNHIFSSPYPPRAFIPLDSRYAELQPLPLSCTSRCLPFDLSFSLSARPPARLFLSLSLSVCFSLPPCLSPPPFFPFSYVLYGRAQSCLECKRAPARNFMRRQRRFFNDDMEETESIKCETCLLYALTVLPRLCHGSSYYAARDYG